MPSMSTVALERAKGSVYGPHSSHALWDDQREYRSSGENRTALVRNSTPPARHSPVCHRVSLMMVIEVTGWPGGGLSGMVVFCPCIARRRKVGPAPTNGVTLRRKRWNFGTMGNSHAVPVRRVENEGPMVDRAPPSNCNRVKSAAMSIDQRGNMWIWTVGPTRYRSAQTFALPMLPRLSDSHTAEIGTPTLSPSEGRWERAQIVVSKKRRHRVTLLIAAAHTGLCIVLPERHVWQTVCF
jgi:hypothetical protein